MRKGKRKGEGKAGDGGDTPTFLPGLTPLVCHAGDPHSNSLTYLECVSHHSV